MDTIYLDYQASTPVAPEILKAMLPYFSEQFGNPHSVDHAAGWEALKTIDTAAKNIANMIGAYAEEIIFTSGATESNNLALLGLARKNQGRKRTKIFVGATEHKCVLAASRVIQAEGSFEVYVIPVDGKGVVDINWLRSRVDDQTLLVSVMAVNNEIGTVAPISEVSELCRSQGVIFHTDAAQAPYGVDLTNLAGLADLISLSGHKMYGPMGIGALYVRGEIQPQLSPIIYGGGQQKNLRSGTVPVPLAAGFGHAAKLHDISNTQKQRMDRARKRDKLWFLIKGFFPTATLNGPDLNARHPGNLNIQFPGIDARDFLLRLQPYVAASTGSACTSGFEEPSHVLSAIGLSEGASNASLRFSLGLDTTNTELEIAAKRMQQALVDQ